MDTVPFEQQTLEELVDDYLRKVEEIQLHGVKRIPKEDPNNYPHP